MYNKKWKLFPFIGIPALMALLIISLFSTATQNLWRPLDESVFRFLNQWISTSVLWQNFWAMANHQLADWVEDFVFISFFIWIVQATPKPLRRKKLAECIFILLWCAITHLLTNELLFRGLLHVKRMSPTLVLDSFTNLPDMVTWLKIKAKSPKSFPGDHATLALLSLFSFLYLARNNYKIAIATTSYALFLCLPRLIVGAHWFTDILIGSGSIVFSSFAIAFFSPLAAVLLHKIEKGLQTISPLLSTKKRLNLNYVKKQDNA